MNQDKLEVVKQEMARVNVDILGISKLKWTGMGEFNSVQFSSVAQSCPTLCDPMNRSTPGLPLHHQLNGHGFGSTPGGGDGQGGLACCGSRGHKELDTTERLN